MRKFGLIGYPLGHSFSRGYFTEKFSREGIENAVYENYPLERIEDFPTLINKQTDLVGLNVTIPYKTAVMPYLDELDDGARAIGAVNTIVVRSELKGYNTDVYGFSESLRPLIKGRDGLRALVLGTGGASKAVCYALDEWDILWQYVSRTPSDECLSYRDLEADHIRENLLIINTTPLGMHPNTDAKPALPYEAVTSEHILYDLVYNPEITAFMQEGMKRGATVKNGLEMLHLQAEKAWDIWNQSTS